MARIVLFVLRLLAPVLAWAGVQGFGRIPAWPFLALTPARTAFWQSVTVAILLAGLIGLSTLLSLSAGPWLLIVAYVLAAVVAIGCGRAFATLWWPAALAGALLGMVLGLAALPRLSARALSIDGPGNQPTILFAGSVVVLWLAFLASDFTIGAMQRLEASDHAATSPREASRVPLGRPKRRRRPGRSRGRP